MKNIKKMRGGRNNELCISWFEDPIWPIKRKELERKHAEYQLKHYAQET